MQTRVVRFSLLLGCAALVLSSCAYYNTFYNAKKTFKEGLTENAKRVGDKPTSGEIQKFDATIEKASKLLQLYPKSKYVDDAIFMLGQCFFYKQEYLKAQRKFEELTANFPKSDLAPMSRVWLAKCQIELRDFAGAERVLRELQKQPRGGGVNEEAQALLGELYYRQEKYARAAEEFEVASKQIGDEPLRARCLMRLGDCHRRTGNPRGAVESFRRASRLKGDPDYKFQSNLQFGIALQEEGQFEAALRIFNSLLAEFPTNRDISLAHLHISQCKAGQGKVEEARTLYAELIENFARTEAAAAAYFELGDMDEHLKGDYLSAQQNYDKARKENVRSDRVGEATRRSKSIGELLKLTQHIAELEDKTKHPQRDAVPPAAADSSAQPRSRRRTARAKTPAPAPAESPARELAKAKIQLAEVYYFQLGKTDSSLHEYRDVALRFADLPEAAQALYSIVYVLESQKQQPGLQDSIRHVLAQKYADTPQGRLTRQRQGDGVSASELHSDELADFQSAEYSLVDQADPQLALAAYRAFIDKYPLSSHVPQSLYAIGWIYEHRLGENRRAFDVYEQLVEKYPNSKFVQELQPKLQTAEKEFKPPQKAGADTSASRSAALDSVAASDSAATDAEALAVEQAKLKRAQHGEAPDSSMTLRKPPSRLRREDQQE